MRFLHTETLQFVEVPDSEVPLQENNYAILSHRWSADGDEVSFEDILTHANITHKKGFAKLKGFCEKASSRRFRYGWADTCCIDKRSSSELAEAIRSMYRWYEGSSFCVAYLEDVPQRDITNSVWFERGWTLQELISPKDVSFFDHDWKPIGTKGEFLAILSLTTGIPENVLSHVAKPSAYSVAQRMSWAAKRKTTKVEDKAYCLIGLFGVSLTPDYGERERAFLRLQQTIVLGSKDESLFAWDMDSGDNTEKYSGLYATSPSSFIDCGRVRGTPGSSGFTEANGELSIRLGTYPYRMETYFAILHCAEEGRSEDRNVILITRLPNEGEYIRVKSSQGVSRMSLTQLKRDNVKERQIRVPVDPKEPPLNVFSGFWLRTLKPPNHDRCEQTILSRQQPCDTGRVCLGEHDWGTAGVARLQPKNTSDHRGWSNIHWILFGFDVEYNPVLLLANGIVPNFNFERLSLLYRPTQRLFERAVETGPGSREHEQIMKNSWIDAKAGIPDRSAGWPTGVSILQVDREKGFSGAVDALNLGISVQLISQCSPTQTPVEGEDGSGLPIRPMSIWTVDITDKGGTSPERDHRHADWHLWLTHCASLPLLLCGCVCCLQLTTAQRIKRAKARHRTGRLNAG